MPRNNNTRGNNRENRNTPVKPVAHNEDVAVFTIVGEITDIFEGKNADYISVKSYHKTDNYYDTFTIRNENIENVDYSVGDFIEIKGHVGTYYDRNKQTTTITLNANSWEIVEQEKKR